VLNTTEKPTTAEVDATPDIEVQMMEYAEAIRRHAGPTSEGRLTQFAVPALGLDDVHFCAGGDAVVVRHGGGAVQQSDLTAQDCTALAAFFSSLANILGYKP
jgi:hypothetical protein